MEFIDFLKYGAIGVSLALAILSYRLLSKEQDQPGVRLPMLNSIKWYFGFALLLSVFFGSAELLSSKKNQPETAAIDKIWNTHFSENPDSTFEQKVNRIARNTGASIALQNNEFEQLQANYNSLASEYAKLQKAYDALLEDENKNGTGFYGRVDLLNSLFIEHNRDWFYLRALPYLSENERVELLGVINDLLIALGTYSDNGIPEEQVLDNWAGFIQQNSAARTNLSKDPNYHIQRSDIQYIINRYLLK